jgi:hypothetical protein
MIGSTVASAVLLGVLGADPSSSARAASEARADLSLVVPPIQRLEIVTPALVMPELTMTELVSRYVLLPQTIQIRVSSNIPWILRMRVDERSAISRPRNEIARLGGEESYQPLSEDWVAVARGDPGADLAMEFRVRVALTDGRLRSGAFETHFDYRLSGAGE